MNLDVFHLQTQQFEEMEQALSSWDHEYRQMSSGSFRGELQHTLAGKCGIFRNRWERAIHYQGTAPAGTIGLAISLVQVGEARWMGQRVSIDDMILQRSGIAAEYLSGNLWDSVVFSIPEEMLSEYIANLAQTDPDRLLNTLGVVHLNPQLAARIREVSLAYLHAAQQFHDSSRNRSLIVNLAHDAVALVAQGLASSRVTSQSNATLQRRNELVRKAREYAADSPCTPLRIGELCRELVVSERTLRHAFCDVTGLNPLDYLKKFRLNRVKRQLRNAIAGEVLVKELAFSNGFTHLGQFSRDYQQLFGELPSQTLVRK